MAAATQLAGKVSSRQVHDGRHERCRCRCWRAVDTHPPSGDSVITRLSHFRAGGWLMAGLASAGDVRTTGAGKVCATRRVMGPTPETMIKGASACLTIFGRELLDAAAPVPAGTGAGCARPQPHATSCRSYWMTRAAASGMSTWWLAATARSAPPPARHRTRMPRPGNAPRSGQGPRSRPGAIQASLAARPACPRAAVARKAPGRAGSQP
jgi:hypothetical protein